MLIKTSAPLLARRWPVDKVDLRSWGQETCGNLRALFDGGRRSS
jgi:hypothetical protein